LHQVLHGSWEAHVWHSLQAAQVHLFVHGLALSEHHFAHAGVEVVSTAVEPVSAVVALSVVIGAAVVGVVVVVAGVVAAHAEHPPHFPDHLHFCSHGLLCFAHQVSHGSWEAHVWHSLQAAQLHLFAHGLALSEHHFGHAGVEVVIEVVSTAVEPVSAVVALGVVVAGVVAAHSEHPSHVPGHLHFCSHGLLCFAHQVPHAAGRAQSLHAPQAGQAHFLSQP